MEELKKRLEIENITKTFVSAKGEEFEAIRDVSFDVRDSEFLVLLGPGRLRQDGPVKHPGGPGGSHLRYDPSGRPGAERLQR